MIILGIDDTDMPNTPGTNQIARKIAAALSPDYSCRFIVRHQLCDAPEIPCTSQNGSASLWFDAADSAADHIFTVACEILRQNFVEGSDPGVAITAHESLKVVEFAMRAKSTIVTQAEARGIATSCGIRLLGLGGTEGGVIGALAALGLAMHQNDGRIVQLGSHADRVGTITVGELRWLGVNVVNESTDGQVAHGVVDLVKKLRPNMRAGAPTLYVEATANGWRALKRH